MLADAKDQGGHGAPPTDVPPVVVATAAFDPTVVKLILDSGRIGGARVAGKCQIGFRR